MLAPPVERHPPHCPCCACRGLPRGLVKHRYYASACLTRAGGGFHGSEGVLSSAIHHHGSEGVLSSAIHRHGSEGVLSSAIQSSRRVRAPRMQHSQHRLLT